MRLRSSERPGSYAHEEITVGSIGIAIAVESDGRFVGSLNLAIPTVRFTKDREVVFRGALKTVASSNGQALASRG
jgi:DNA-binding IclR family transcriptional regulator